MCDSNGLQKYIKKTFLLSSGFHHKSLIVITLTCLFALLYKKKFFSARYNMIKNFPVLFHENLYKLAIFQKKQKKIYRNRKTRIDDFDVIEVNLLNFMLHNIIQ